VQFAHGKYQMHPGIRTAALTRLKSSPQWVQTHRAIAQYWFNSNEQIQTSQQGLQVLEAYHHFITIQDYDSAWDVLRRRAISALPEELFLYFLSWGFIREVKQLAQTLLSNVNELIKDVEQARDDYRHGNVRRGSVADLMAELDE